MRVTETRMDKAKFPQEIERFSEKNEFQVNPDHEKVESLVLGIFERAYAYSTTGTLVATNG
jgi:ferredoxin-thioredoxin reductase catalytic subunit